MTATSSPKTVVVEVRGLPRQSALRPEHLHPKTQPFFRALSTGRGGIHVLHTPYNLEPFPKTRADWVWLTFKPQILNPEPQLGGCRVQEDAQLEPKVPQRHRRFEP
jgi:hypothetical protein